MSRHAVQFYRRDESFCELAAHFIADGLRGGERVVLVVTGEHQDGIRDRCRAAGVESGIGGGMVEFVDATGLLASIMDGEVLSRERFTTWVQSTAAPHQGDARRIRVFGELGDLVSRRFGLDSAVRLETWWDELSGKYALDLCCGFAVNATDREDFDVGQICRHHDVIRPAEWIGGDVDDVPPREPGDRVRAATASTSDTADKAVRLEREVERARYEIRRLQLALDAAAEASRRAQEDRRNFFDSISHELCTPLNAIVGYQDLLDLGVGGPISGLQRTYLSRIRKGTRELIDLVEQLLCLSTNDAGPVLDIRPLDAGPIARGVGREARRLAASKGLRVRLRIPVGPIPCETDPVLLQQILLNLLSNAIRFTEHGFVSVRVLAGTDAVRFLIRDTGPGIEAENLTRIFEPFIRGADARVSDGAGLGLAVSRRLARRLGGDIYVRSAPGRGSVFTLWLPTTTAGRQVPADGTSLPLPARP